MKRRQKRETGYKKLKKLGIKKKKILITKQELRDFKVLCLWTTVIGSVYSHIKGVYCSSRTLTSQC